ncbi:hypothetical protein BHE74_00002499 [Ensete ventricosum]|nr:hypothetical protein GW17_00020269 [Ensete ventricosum]RWW88620.1 hypothetical protein BHE74_00002499 [Ensete ventricosum]
MDRKPGEKGATIASIFLGSAGLRMGFPVGVHGVSFGALVTLPPLLSMLPGEVLLDPCQVTERPGRVVVHARWLRANVDPLPCHFLAASLPQLPWQIVAPPVELQVLVSLETLVTYLADKSVGGHQRVG